MNFLTKKRFYNNSTIKDNKKTNTSSNITKDDKFNGSKFRMLNEFLYTNNSKEAVDYFDKNKEDFEIYHKGFSSQAGKWPINPNDIFIKELLKKQYRNKNIVDLGCGEANIAKALLEKDEKTKIKSFDIVALNNRVTVCDIKNLPLESNSTDIGIFCLSLMGTNFIDFILEANRILKNNGVLFIAEIESRIKNQKEFENAIRNCGFRLSKTKDVKGYFKIFIFRKVNTANESAKVKVKSKYSDVLDPCMYRKR